MENQGWIKLHRKLLESSIFSSEKGLKVWIWCLLKANHKDNDVFKGRQKVNIKSGQFITGRDVAKEELEMGVGTIWFWLERLSVERYIERQATNKFTVITILNYNKYQKDDRELNANRLTDGTQMERKSTTNNNDKNEKNDNNTYIERATSKYLSIKSITQDDLQDISIKYNVPLPFVMSKLDDMENWLVANGKKYKDYKAALMNWVKRDAIKVIQEHKNQPFMKKGGFEEL